MNIFKKILQFIAIISLAVFILLGILIVMIQAVGIVTLNSTLAQSVDMIKTISIASAGILGVSSFILSYLTKDSKTQTKEGR